MALMNETERFELAPMTLDLRLLTYFCWLLPAAFVYSLLALPASMPPVIRTAQLAVTAFLLLIYASVYFLFRPLYFEVTADGLGIIWPLRARAIPKSQIRAVRTMEAKAFRAEYGYGMRVGAGGLWGGFGLLKTSKQTFSMWISRTDAFVLIDLDGDRPLLLTPKDPALFTAAIERLIHTR